MRNSQKALSDTILTQSQQLAEQRNRNLALESSAHLQIATASENECLKTENLNLVCDYESRNARLTADTNRLEYLEREFPKSQVSLRDAEQEV